jgi:hypothetical protein
MGDLGGVLSGPSIRAEIVVFRYKPPIPPGAADLIHGMLLAGLNNGLGGGVVLDGVAVEECVTVAYAVTPVLKLKAVAG